MRQLVFVFLAPVIIILASVAQEITTTPDGRHLVTFTASEQSAIDQFLANHPNMIEANCATLGLSASACAASYEEWHRTVISAKAVPQSQYAVWGNYSHRESPDLAIPFFSKTSVNNWGWRRWEIVVFEPTASNRYKPIIALTDSWGTCLDGMLYHPVRKQIEFWCNSMGGSVRWNGTTFIGTLHKGD
jgi:hypothetical protein